MYIRAEGNSDAVRKRVNNTVINYPLNCSLVDGVRRRRVVSTFSHSSRGRGKNGERIFCVCLYIVLRLYLSRALCRDELWLEENPEMWEW